MTRVPTRAVIFSLALALGVAACSGGSSNGTLPLATNDLTQTVSDTADALVARRTGTQSARDGIAAANALGGRIRQLQNAAFYDAWNATRPSLISHGGGGRCQNGVELFAPDRNGDANSTEALFFYDAGCSQVALDDVRVYTATGANSETVRHTDSFYRRGATAATGVAIGNSSISNATIGAYGIPSVSAGFSDVTTAQVSVGSSQELNAGGEFVMTPGSGSLQTFCGDSAGYDPSGIVSLDETFGWQGGILSGGSRTSSGNLVTWSATPSGTIFSAATGGLSIATATPNTSCPIASPYATLRGGSALGTYSLPISVTFAGGQLYGITVKNAMLPGGDTLNVRTHRGKGWHSHRFIAGSITSGHTPIASFGLDAFGNGMLTVTSTGAQYKIVDWIVVQ